MISNCLNYFTNQKLLTDSSKQRVVSLFHIFNLSGKNPFNQRRSTAQEEDFEEIVPNKKTGNVNMTAPLKSVERKDTSGSLNRNESTSHLSNKMDAQKNSREVELKA
jgi:hypothetical protein